MARASLESLFSRDRLDGLFERTARVQYTRELLFSQLVELMIAVVLRQQPLVRAAYLKRYREHRRLQPGRALMKASVLVSAALGIAESSGAEWAKEEGRVQEVAMTLPEERRREVFAALVAAQDGGLSVPASRKKVAVEQGISVDQLRQIEKEGLDAQWPPLDA